MTDPNIQLYAAGLDLGGTKIEVQLFDANWSVTDKRRVDTPTSYPDLIDVIADLIRWAQTQTRTDIPTGIGAAGLINPQTGHALTANICANGKPLPADITAAILRPVTYINDARAIALSEAVFGAGRGHGTVMSVILGTGVGGGIAVDGTLRMGPTLTGGEFGHCSASAALIMQHGLPVFECGCGRMGCIETYISGRGLERLAHAITGTAMTSRQIAQTRNGLGAQVWSVWLDLTVDFLRNLILTVDPDVIVLGGGLSNIDGLADALSTATIAAQIGDFAVPPIVLAQGGDTSGARGAAYAAWLGAQ